MRDVRPIAKPIFKLYDAGGNLLGTATIPEEWVDRLYQDGPGGGIVPFQYSPGICLRSMLADELPDGPVARFGQLSRAYPDRAGLMLLGITVEQFEMVLGCTFAPSAYLVAEIRREAR